MGAIQPNIGPIQGFGQVTLAGADLGNGSDIYSVTIGNNSLPIVWQNGSYIVATLPPAQSAFAAAPVVLSTSFGRSTGPVFSYVLSSIVQSVHPPTGPSVGNTTVTLSGNYLGDGLDIHNVTVRGLASLIVSQTTSQLILLTPPADPGIASISFNSVLFGPAHASDVYTYNPPAEIYRVIPSHGPLGPSLRLTIIGQHMGSGITSCTSEVLLHNRFAEQHCDHHRHAYPLLRASPIFARSPAFATALALRCSRINQRCCTDPTTSIVEGGNDVLLTFWLDGPTLQDVVLPLSIRSRSAERL